MEKYKAPALQHGVNFLAEKLGKQSLPLSLELISKTSREDNQVSAESCSLIAEIVNFLLEADSTLE